MRIWQAYNLAKKAHFGVYRKSGEPYLSHPVSVASILADIGVESHIISAALLHDVYEDTTYTYNDISKECGERVAKYVDAVTSLHKEYANSHSRSEYSMDKYDLDDKTFDKLVKMVYSDSKMVFALFIKAADRIHNLSTMEVMQSEKQFAELDETELDYLPLFKEFKLNYFVKWINDLSWQVSNPLEYQKYKATYEKLYSKNKEYVNEMHRILIDNLGDEFNQYCARLFGISGYDFSIEKRPYRPLEVYHFVRSKVGDSNVSPEMIDKCTLPTCDFDVIIDGKDPRSDIDAFATMFVKMFVEKISPTGRAITDLETDEYGRFIVRVEDRCRNDFRICFCMRDDYTAYNYGSVKGVFSEAEVEQDKPLGDTMIVKLRNGNTMTVPKGITALDLAFMIHVEIGLFARTAIINGRQADLSNILHDEDKVVIISDSEQENGNTVNYIRHARIGWLGFVKTKLARDRIIRYLESQYEGDNYKRISSTQDDALDNVRLNMWSINQKRLVNESLF